MKNKKIAIVYDWMDSWGGVERVLLTLHQMFPNAPFFTSYYDRQNTPWAQNLDIRPSFMQNLPNFIQKSRILSLPFYPYAFESIDLSQFDVVVSVTSSFAKSVITRPPTVHICYLLTPTRFLWTHEKDYLKGTFSKSFTSPYLSYLKKWDKLAAQRPDHYIAISETVKSRLKKYYGRNSDVIYPPFDLKYWQNIKSQIVNNKKHKVKELHTTYSILNTPYYLLVSRLEPYKRVDLAIKAVQTMHKPLVIVGKGSQANKLKHIASKHVTFLQDVTDLELAQLYLQAQALIMPQEEDFGLTALEAQYFGLPVIAYKKGGATETVIDGKTGIFFKKQTVPSLSRALEKYESQAYNLHQSTKKHWAENVEKFSRVKFEANFLRNIKTYIQYYENK